MNSEEESSINNEPPATKQNEGFVTIEETMMQLIKEIKEFKQLLLDQLILMKRLEEKFLIEEYN